MRRLFSYGGANSFDPFPLLDYAGPHRFEPAEAIERAIEDYNAGRMGHLDE